MRQAMQQDPTYTDMEARHTQEYQQYVSSFKQRFAEAILRNMPHIASTLAKQTSPPLSQNTSVSCLNPIQQPLLDQQAAMAMQMGVVPGNPLSNMQLAGIACHSRTGQSTPQQSQAPIVSQNAPNMQAYSQQNFPHSAAVTSNSFQPLRQTPPTLGMQKPATVPVPQSHNYYNNTVPVRQVPPTIMNYLPNPNQPTGYSQVNMSKNPIGQGFIGAQVIQQQQQPAQVVDTIDNLRQSLSNVLNIERPRIDSSSKLQQSNIVDSETKPMDPVRDGDSSPVTNIKQKPNPDV